MNARPARFAQHSGLAAVSTRGGRLRDLLAPSAEYRGWLARFERRDAGLALALVAIYSATLYLKGRWDAARPYPGEVVEVALGIAETGLWLLVIWVIVARRGQGFASVGFSRARLGRSLLAGVIAAALVVAVTAAFGLLVRGWLQTPAAYWFTWGVPYYLVVIGFSEELFWRGFVTPRIAAQFTRQWVGVALAGAIFALMHLSYRAGANPLPLTEFLAANWPFVLMPMAWHWVLWFLYARWNSLAAPTLLHWAFNWSSLLL